MEKSKLWLWLNLHLRLFITHNIVINVFEYVYFKKIFITTLLNVLLYDNLFFPKTKVVFKVILTLSTNNDDTLKHHQDTKSSN